LEECRNAGPSSSASVDRWVCYLVVVVVDTELADAVVVADTEFADVVVVVVVVVLQPEGSQP
jgi:hypothetical protein